MYDLMIIFDNSILFGPPCVLALLTVVTVSLHNAQKHPRSLPGCINNAKIVSSNSATRPNYVLHTRLSLPRLNERTKLHRHPNVGAKVPMNII